jgi:hypothetical protein
MTKLEMKEIRKALSTPGTKFTISGNRLIGDKVFVSGDGYITSQDIFGKTMNIEYTGATKMDLYTFDMLGKKSTGTIYFETVTIINE